MTPSCFDAFTRALAHALSRRTLLPVLGSLFVTPLLGALPAAAKKKNKKKTTLCLDGQTIEATKKKKKKLLKSGATPGACSPPPPPGCTPSCAGNSCGGDDGCGGSCGCAANALCHGGLCHPCDVACTGNNTACGNELQTVLTGAGGGTVYACPGRYVGNFTLGNGALIGAGDGEDPATNTILDANGSGRVVDVNAGVSAALRGLRITGGNPPGDGGGIRNQGTLTLTACTVDQNTASGGGGILHAGSASSPLTLNDCVVSRNKAGGNGLGGGIHTGLSPITIKGSALTDNEAVLGGGLYNEGTAIFDSASSVTGNSATDFNGGGGIYNFVGGTVTLNGATVSGNTPDNCVNVTGC